MKIIILLTLTLTISLNTSAQYAKDKLEYDYKSYEKDTTDKYKPVISGVASFLFPGFGQIYCDEDQRGYDFMKGFGASVLLMMGGGIILYPYDPDSKTNNLGEDLFIIGYLAAVTITIWSSIDAVRIAKVKNLALRDEKSDGITLNLRPFIHNNLNIDGESYGLSCVVSF